MEYNKIFADLSTDLHTIICKYKRKAIYVLPKDRLTKYNWKYLIRAVTGYSYNVPTKELMRIYYSMCKQKKMYASSHYIIIKLNDGTLMYRYLFNIEFKKIEGLSNFIVDIACEADHVFIVLSDGTLMVAGSSTLSGNYRIAGSLVFEEIKGIPKKVVQVSCCYEYVIIKLSDGVLMKCAKKKSYISGVLEARYSFVFEKIEENKETPVNIISEINYNYSVSRMNNGKLMTYGCNYRCRKPFVIGKGWDLSEFVELEGIPKNIVDVKCYEEYITILLSNGKLGRVYGGISPLKFREMINTPKNVIDFDDMNGVSIIICCDSLLGCKSERTTLMWKYNYEGEFFKFAPAPENIVGFQKFPSAPENIVEFQVFGKHVIVRCNDGRLFQHYLVPTFGEFTEIKSIPNELLSE